MFRFCFSGRFAFFAGQVNIGGRLFSGCPVNEIIMEGDEAKGVVLSKHAVFPEAEVRARRAVVSNLSCHPTFRGLIGEDKLPSWVKAGVDNKQVFPNNYNQLGWNVNVITTAAEDPEAIAASSRVPGREEARCGH